MFAATFKTEKSVISLKVTASLSRLSLHLPGDTSGSEEGSWLDEVG